MMGGPMMWRDYSQLTPEQLKQRQYMMDRWMPMQQPQPAPPKKE